MRTAFRIIVMLLAALVLVSVAFLGGFATSRAVFTPPAANQIKDGAPADWKESMPVFWEAWNIVSTEFYKQPVDPGKMAYGAVAGMVDSLGDQNTVFWDARQAELFNSDLEGSFEGIGAVVEMKEGRLIIQSPIKGTPADRAGLKAGDFILQVNDTVIQNMTVNEAIALIRGKRGTTVRLLIQRGNQPPFSVSIVRDKIVVPSVETRMLEDNTIAYVKLNQFTATATDELHQMLEQVMALHPEGLIFDLRNDPGGYLNVAVDVGSEFLKEDQVLLLERRKTGRDEELRTHGGGVATDIPMVLLINGGSASASEIIAAALKDYKRATLIGTKTYGKGSVQVTHALSDGSQLHVTIAHWLSPLGHEINKASVLPDIEVDDPTPAEDSKNIDRQLDRAIEFLKSQSAFDANPWRLFALPAFVPAPLP